MPAESVIYVTELEDLVARVDHELSITPESVELWSQRVNLLLDLEARGSGRCLTIPGRHLLELVVRVHQTQRHSSRTHAPSLF